MLVEKILLQQAPTRAVALACIVRDAARGISARDRRPQTPWCKLSALHGPPPEACVQPSSTPVAVQLRCQSQAVEQGRTLKLSYRECWPET
jgi:hypothetical protein